MTVDVQINEVEAGAEAAIAAAASAMAAAAATEVPPSVEKQKRNEYLTLRSPWHWEGF